MSAERLAFDIIAAVILTAIAILGAVAIGDRNE